MEKVLYFLLAKVPMIVWIIISLYFMFHNFGLGLVVFVALGVLVIIWTMFTRWCFKSGITYEVHITKKQKKKLNKK